MNGKHPVKYPDCFIKDFNIFHTTSQKLIAPFLTGTFATLLITRKVIPSEMAKRSF